MTTAAAAKPERPWAPQRACASRASRAPRWAARLRRDGEGGLAGTGVQVESSGGGPRVSQPKEAGGAEQRRAGNDVGPGTPPSRQAASVAMTTAAPG